MIPLNTFTPEPVLTAFQAPADQPYSSLEESHRGGIAISDGSKGRNVQTWTGRYERETVNIYAEGATTPGYSLVMPGVLTLSIGFDNNMRPVVAYQTATGSHLHFYDTSPESYSIIDIADGTSCRCCTDDVRDLYNTQSDVIFGYVRADGHLYYRIQRERFLIEHHVGDAEGAQLVRMGQSHGRRLTFQLRQF